MSILVLSENSNSELKSSTLNTIFAATKIKDDIHVLVIGNKCEKVVEKISKIKEVKKILHLDSPEYDNPPADIFYLMLYIFFIILLNKCHNLEYVYKNYLIIIKIQ